MVAHGFWQPPVPVEGPRHFWAWHGHTVPSSQGNKVACSQVKTLSFAAFGFFLSYFGERASADVGLFQGCCKEGSLLLWQRERHWPKTGHGYA